MIQAMTPKSSDNALIDAMAPSYISHNYDKCHGTITVAIIIKS